MPLTSWENVFTPDEPYESRFAYTARKRGEGRGRGKPTPQKIHAKAALSTLQAQKADLVKKRDALRGDRFRKWVTTQAADLDPQSLQDLKKYADFLYKSGLIDSAAAAGGRPGMDRGLQFEAPEGTRPIARMEGTGFGMKGFSPEGTPMITNVGAREIPSEEDQAFFERMNDALAWYKQQRTGGGPQQVAKLATKIFENMMENPPQKADGSLETDPNVLMQMAREAAQKMYGVTPEEEGTAPGGWGGRVPKPTAKGLAPFEFGEILTGKAEAAEAPAQPQAQNRGLDFAGTGPMAIGRIGKGRSQATSGRIIKTGVDRKTGRRVHMIQLENGRKIMRYAD